MGKYILSSYREPFFTFFPDIHELVVKCYVVDDRPLNCLNIS